MLTLNSGPDRRKKLILLSTFLFCYLLIAWRVVFAPLYPSDSSRNSTHGDAYSDKNTHSAVNYFFDHGFTRSAFLPMHNYDGENPETVHAYTHYPALPDILAGFYAKILNTPDDRLIRIFPVLISIGFFFLIFYFLNRILPDKNAAFISSVILVLSNYFIFWADTLHKHLYEELFRWTYVCLLYLYYEGGRRKKSLLLLAGLVFILTINASFEPVLYLAFCTAAFSWIYTRRLISAETVFLALMPFVGFGLHLYQNTVYFGSWDETVNDLTRSFFLRTTGADDPQNELKRAITWVDYVSIPWTYIYRIERFFLIPGLAFLPLAILGLKKLKQESLRSFQIAVTLLLATFTWNLFMTQHAVVHKFTGKHIGLFYGMVIGYGLLSYYGILKKHYAERKMLFLAAHVVFIGYILALFCFEHIYWQYLRFGFLYPWLGA